MDEKDVVARLGGDRGKEDNSGIGISGVRRSEMSELVVKIRRMVFGRKGSESKASEMYCTKANLCGSSYVLYAGKGGARTMAKRKARLPC